MLIKLDHSEQAAKGSAAHALGPMPLGRMPLGDITGNTANIHKPLT
jgi:hypothetical protein